MTENHYMVPGSSPFRVSVSSKKVIVGISSSIILKDGYVGNQFKERKEPEAYED